MRNATRVSAATFVITSYYALLFGGTWLLVSLFPGSDNYLPFGGIAELVQRGADDFIAYEGPDLAGGDVPYLWRLLIAIPGAVLLMVPITWVYFLTTQQSRIDRSFSQTMIILPVIVAGTAIIVQSSIALAFSLAGIVAVVRFRFTLDEPSHTLYVFAAIVVGLAAGISALGIATVVSVAFVYVTLVLWRTEYGRNMNSPFFSFLTGRDHEEDDV